MRNLKILALAFFLTLSIGARAAMKADTKNSLESVRNEAEKKSKELEGLVLSWERKLLGLMESAQKSSLAAKDLEYLLVEVAKFLPYAKDNGVGENLEQLKSKYGKNFDIALERIDTLSATLIREAMNRSESAED